MVTGETRSLDYIASLSLYQNMGCLSGSQSNVPQMYPKSKPYTLNPKPLNPKP